MINIINPFDYLNLAVARKLIKKKEFQFYFEKLAKLMLNKRFEELKEIKIFYSINYNIDYKETDKKIYYINLKDGLTLLSLLEKEV